MMVESKSENRRYSIAGIPFSVLVPLIGYIFTFIIGMYILKNDFAHEVDMRCAEDARLHDQHNIDINRLELTRDKEINRIVLALERLGDQIRQDNLQMWKAIRRERDQDV